MRHWKSILMNLLPHWFVMWYWKPKPTSIKSAPSPFIGESPTFQHTDYALDAIERAKHKRIWRGQKRLQAMKNGGWIVLGKFEGEDSPVAAMVKDAGQAIADELDRRIK